MERPPLESFFKSPIQPEDIEPEVSPETITKALRGKKGDKGDVGTNGKDGIDGKDGVGLVGPPGEKGERGERGFPGEEGRAGKDGTNGIDGKDGDEAKVTGKLVIDKINKNKTEKIKRSKIEGLDDIENKAASTEKRLQNFISLGGSRETRIKVGGVLYTGVETISFPSGVTATPVGDGKELSLAIAGGTGYTLLVAGGAVNGINQTFTFTSAPTFIVADGAWYQALDNNGATNWSGATTVTMTIPPNSAIWGFK